MEFLPIEKTPEELKGVWVWTRSLEYGANYENVEQAFWAPNTLLWGIEREGERVGHIALTNTILDHSASFHCLIYDRHPLNYVREVRSFLEETISELGLKMLLMCFWTGYNSTPKFVRKLGFRVVGKVPDLLYAQDGLSLDAWVAYKTPIQPPKGWLERIKRWVGAQQ